MRLNILLYLCLALPLLVGPAAAEDASQTFARPGRALTEVLSPDTAARLEIATGSALETIAIHPHVAFASQHLQERTLVRPWKQRAGATSLESIAQADAAAIRHALTAGLQGATTCWQRARLTGLITTNLTVQATFAANGTVERLTVSGGESPGDRQLSRCLDYVARRIRLPEPPGERVFVYTQVAFASSAR